ncbi:DNA excision repair protein ERCC-6-like 2 [Polyodon spathula]|uniref:DNA excision repair protein ERCC-6-like 2 n=1 Tax=Polyodon spathula TaxID=7913 RepID=UPI001B7E3450|nr:DNA excision repair protein ERCC-6-like 2 [Polyodon spathula]
MSLLIPGDRRGGAKGIDTSGDGKLNEARIKTLVLEEQDKAVAVMKFVGFDEETVSVKKLQKIKCPQSHKRSFIFDYEDLEKPFFHDRKPPGPALPCMLSEHGECIPYTINRYLQDYQREGVMFIYSHYVKGRGCILGDDMGLGKTVQDISFLAAVLHKKGTREDIENNMPEFLLKKKESRPIEAKKIFRIVAPLSVLYNWKDELDTRGYFRGTILHGTRKEAEFPCVKRGKCDFALTTYETLHLCLSDFNSIKWSAVIVDEAHKIKNPNSQITQDMRALKCNVRVGLTGTILQNNMEELWCVMDLAIPGCLGSLYLFKAKVSDPVAHGQKHDVTKINLAVRRKAIRRLARKLSCWFLRRTKSLISCQFCIDCWSTAGRTKTKFFSSPSLLRRHIWQHTLLEDNEPCAGDVRSHLENGPVDQVVGSENANATLRQYKVQKRIRGSFLAFSTFFVCRVKGPV